MVCVFTRYLLRVEIYRSAQNVMAKLTNRLVADYIRTILTPYSSFRMPAPAEMKVIVEVLDAYKQLPCLWDTAHHLYHSKEERDRAYNLLTDIYRVAYPDATKEIVKKKLDNMRNAYRREYKKVLASKAAGTMVHIPVLWYYHHLTFLDGNREDDDCTYIEISEEPIKIEDDDEEIAAIENSNSNGPSGSADASQRQESPPPKKIRITFEDPLETEVTQSRLDDPDESDHKKPEMSQLSETYGRTVGLQLQELEPMQRYIAEKLISDVIFYGRLRKLNTESTINIRDNKSSL